MNKNTKIAKQLVKIAKELIGSNNKEYNLQRDYISLWADPSIKIYVTGINKFQMKKILKEIENKTGGKTNIYAQRFGAEIFFDTKEDLITDDESKEPFPTLIKILQNNGFRRNKQLTHTEFDSVTEEEREEYEKEQLKGKEKKAEIGWDSRGMEREIWLNLSGVTSMEKKKVNQDVYHTCQARGLDYVKMQGNEIKFHMTGGNVSKSEYSKDPFKTIIEVLEKNGFTVS